MLVSLELVKKQVVLDGYDGDDDLLTFQIESAEEYVVKQTHRTIAELESMTSDGKFPKMLQQAIMLVVAQWYDHREPVANTQFHELPNNIQALIRPYRRLVKCEQEG